ncbi:MAG: hypothetical protein JWN81_779, partial [Solirubrobacterales bacterium]|nr:hypothetical protein [Solirubrobacterales bacterium]
MTVRTTSIPRLATAATALAVVVLASSVTA